MFRDTKEELDRLEAELLAEEEPEAQAEETDPLDALLEDPDDIGGKDGPMVYQNYSNDYGRSLRNFANGYGAYNTDETDTDLDSYSEAVREPEQDKGLKGLIMTALLLTAGIVVMVIWWILRFSGR